MLDKRTSRATRAIRASTDLRSLLAAIRQHARPLVAADGITVVLRDGDVCFYADEDAIGPLWKGRRFPIDSCVSGWVMQHETCAVIPDVYEDERVPSAAYRPTFVKSLAMVPIGHGTIVAALGAYWATAHDAAPHEVRALTLVARAAADVLRDICPRCHERVRAPHPATDTTACVCDACHHAWTA